MADITALGFDTVDLADAIQKGQVRSQGHPEFPQLKIYNYTEEVQYRKWWNNITLQCRGLILNHETHEIVARPWEKFFNLGERDNRIDSLAPVEVTDKIDGSLGILYWNGTKHAIATRGSFASEQAIHATTLFDEFYAEFMHEVEWHNYTFLFEIVYPENRIVVNYGDMDDLVLLGAVHNEQGYYLGPLEAQGLLNWTGPVTEVFHYKHFVDAISAPDRAGKEGYVIRSGDKMVKLKQSDYVELHRIVTNLSPKTIWEMMASGKSVADICAGIPDEFHSYVENIGNELLRRSAEIKYAAKSEYLDSVSLLPPFKRTRRAFAEKAVKSEYRALLFLLFDGRPIDGVVWNMVKPRGDVKTLVKDEG